MVSPTQGLLRWLRASWLGVLGFAASLVTHVAAGGAVPRLMVLCSSGGARRTGCGAAHRGPLERGAYRGVLDRNAVGAARGLHVARRPGAIRDDRDGHPASSPMAHGARVMFACATGMTIAGMGQTSGFALAAMLGADAGATTAMVARVGCGEKVLWFLACWVRLSRRLHGGHPELLAMPMVFFGAPQMSRMQPLRGGVGRRGPPTRGLCTID